MYLAGKCIHLLGRAKLIAFIKIELVLFSFVWQNSDVGTFEAWFVGY